MILLDIKTEKKIKLVLYSQSALFLDFMVKKYRVQRTKLLGIKGKSLAM